MIETYTRENQIQELATMIRDTGNTCATHLYAIQNKNTSLILNYKNKMFYTTRASVREARRALLETNAYSAKEVRIVTTDFVNVCPWKTAK